ncbi:hypothetical protein [Neobacillus jeddahensis]|uniref:hypothetical protein n=1 Tax=Neobacillus jeddahensis TaxID=1461580 RepID=UPI0005907F59|nr:hypothetical protein [Neobacillus jeddahensis]
MKKLIGFLLSILVVYVIYFDLTVGTLPTSKTLQVDAKIETNTVESKKTTIPFFDAKVKPGETLISIVEHQLDKPLPVPMTKLIDDFQQLNSDQSAEKIQIGITYHFPDYSQ